MTAAIGTLFGGGEMLAIDRIRRDPRTQPRNHINHEVVERYRDAMEAGDAFPPVTVFFDGTDYWLADGWHRVCAALCLGWQTIAIEVRPGGLREAEWHSFSVNATHGYPRGKDDAGRILGRIFGDPEWSAKPLREIHRHTSIPWTTVQNHHVRFLSGRPNQIKPVEREVERGTSSYTMNTANIGRSPAPEQSYEARHRWTPEDIADYAARHRVDENGNPVEYDDEADDDTDDEVDDDARRGCAHCRFMEWHDSFQAWECTVYRKETGPDNIAGYSCPAWEEEPPEDEAATPERDPKFAFAAFPPEHAKPAGMIRYLLNSLRQELTLSPEDLIAASPWTDAAELREEATFVSDWLTRLAWKLLDEEE